MNTLHATHFLVLILTCVFIPWAYAQEGTPTPARPATYLWDGLQFEIRYAGQIVFQALLENPGALEGFNTVVSNGDEKVEHVFKWVGRKEPLRFTGQIRASIESFPCEAERKEDAPLMVRHSVGLSRSLLNRAVYDRKGDWLLSADFPTSIIVVPASIRTDKNIYSVTVSGRDVILRFRPSYYQKFKGLKYFQPWTYRICDRSIAGWVSWFAYFKDITEENVKGAADVLAEVLLPYGLEYLQIDDGYQQTPVGVPHTWLVPNAKFPSGLRGLSSYIRTKGLKPGIWTNVSFYQKEFVRDNAELFVRDALGNPAYGNWVGYVMDGSNPRSIDSLIRPVYRGLRGMGWEYYKVDALRHLRYEGYNSFADHFVRKGVDREEVYRGVVKSIREEIGAENVLMGCWGIRPELVGLIDACRIGDDGFGYGGLAQYNSYNNVVWRNDPDHIQLTPEEAYRSCMVTTLTGSLFMLTDKPEVYKTSLVEPAKRSLPVLFTRPAQVYDVEASRSGLIGMVGSEVSGAGPRAVDADQRAYCNLYLLEVNRPFESWMVLGRLEGGRDTMFFSDLGLNAQSEYIAFEFWTKTFAGSFTKALPLSGVDSAYRCQAYCVREKKPHPQVIATNRHISCGGYDLKHWEWSEDTLSGESELVGGDEYALYLTEPEGYVFRGFSTSGAMVVSNWTDGAMRVIRIRNGQGGAARWRAAYRVSGPH